MPRYQAECRLALGAALRRRNHRLEARPLLKEALDVGTRTGALRTAREAGEELRATGARPRRVMLTGIESLTPSERRVCRLVADGRTNREVAQALFVTPKTIERHLYNAFDKLGINARGQLAEALGPAMPLDQSAS
jgi:DNA-binding CsgD family transcriptional regulator